MPWRVLKVCHHASDTYSVITYGREKKGHPCNEDTGVQWGTTRAHTRVKYMCLQRAQTGAVFSTYISGSLFHHGHYFFLSSLSVLSKDAVNCQSYTAFVTD